MEPLDWDALRNQCAGDEALVREVVDLYRAQWGALLHDIQQAVAAADLPAARRAAHRLKGGLLSLAATPSVALSQEVERAAAAGDVPAMRASLAKLELELARLATALS